LEGSSGSSDRGSRAENTGFRNQRASGWRQFAQFPQIGKGKDPGLMTIRPKHLESISAYLVELDQLKRTRSILHFGPHDPTERIRLALANRARTSTSNERQWKINLHSVFK
jgi:hypothetical protein